MIERFPSPLVPGHPSPSPHFVGVANLRLVSVPSPTVPGSSSSGRLYIYRCCSRATRLPLHQCAVSFARLKFGSCHHQQSSAKTPQLNPACHRVIPLVGRNRPIARTSFSSQTLASTPRSHWGRSQSHRNPQFRTIFPPGKSNQNKTEVELADQLTVLPPCLGKLLQSAFVRACPPIQPMQT